MKQAVLVFFVMLAMRVSAMAGVLIPSNFQGVWTGTLAEGSIKVLITSNEVRLPEEVIPRIPGEANFQTEVTQDTLTVRVSEQVYTDTVTHFWVFRCLGGRLDYTYYLDGGDSGINPNSVVKTELTRNGIVIPKKFQGVWTGTLKDGPIKVVITEEEVRLPEEVMPCLAGEANFQTEATQGTLTVRVSERVYTDTVTHFWVFRRQGERLIYTYYVQGGDSGIDQNPIVTTKLTR